MTRNLTCIICPRGCALTAETDGDGLKVTGFGCKKGEQYAIDECTHPVRTVTSIVRVKNREDTMVSVKTAEPVAKEDIFKVMKLIRAASANAPIAIGDVICDNCFGTSVVATKNID